ncbi:hypothetical protein HPP92_023418 [Vanilla planifolia]|uniref:Uncharacterized protein n=1 Tax=Vanilla planifolia TaxID=51239 RepID=A0A835UG85_VANPL|nr:hypothetical protein HPP92_023418 [Vanilla planifolia]
MKRVVNWERKRRREKKRGNQAFTCIGCEGMDPFSKKCETTFVKSIEVIVR